MAQDLKTPSAKSENLAVGQFWRDTVNRDLLKIQELTEYTPDPSPGVSPWKSISMVDGQVIREPWPDGDKPIQCEVKPAQPVRYVRCACYPRGKYFLGIQEMRAMHFDTPRFQQIELGRFKRLWYRWKFRKP